VGPEQRGQHRHLMLKPGLRPLHLCRQAGRRDPLLRVPARLEARRAGRAARVPDNVRPYRRAGLPVCAARRKHAVAFINLDTSASRTVTFSAVAGLTGTLRSWSYSAGSQTRLNPTSSQEPRKASSVTNGITLPPESITVLQTQ